MKKLLLLITLLLAFAAYQSQADELSIGAEIVLPAETRADELSIEPRADESSIGAEIVRPSEAQASIYGDADMIAAMCAAITGIVATEVEDNAAKLRFADANWWSQYTTEALIEEYKANLREVAAEDWDRAWPIIVEGDLECHNLKAKALNESME